MGLLCAWCGSIMRPSGSVDAAISHVMCSGCYEDLEVALSRCGFRIHPDPAAAEHG